MYEYRSLKPDFLERLHRTKAKARGYRAALTGKVMDSELRLLRFGESFKHGAFNHWRAGRPVTFEVHADIFSAITRSRNQTFDPYRGLLADYLNKDDLREPLKAGVAYVPMIETIVEATSAPSGKAEWVHPFEIPHHQYFAEIENRQASLEGVSAPLPRELIPTGVHWLFVAAGRKVSRNPDLSAADSVAVTEREMAISSADFTKRALEWSDVEPWTVAGVRNSKKNTWSGMSVILPLRDDVYNEIVKGHKRATEITAYDLSTPSRNVMIYGTCFRPTELGGPRKQGHLLKLELAASMTVQSSYVADTSALALKGDVRAMSLGVCDEGKRWLKAAGFVPTGAYLPENPRIAIVEKTYNYTRDVIERHYIKYLFWLAKAFGPHFIVGDR